MNDPESLLQTVESAIADAERRLALLENLIGLDEAVVGAAVEALGTQEKADEWLIFPAPALGGRAPAEVAFTAGCPVEVLDLLGQMRHGDVLEGRVA